MTVYEEVKNFSVEQLAGLFTDIAISAATSAVGNSPISLIVKAEIEKKREEIFSDYLRLLNSETPETEGEK